jgi:hypothetical protein
MSKALKATSRADLQPGLRHMGPPVSGGPFHIDPATDYSHLI